MHQTAMLKPNVTGCCVSIIDVGTGKNSRRSIIIGWEVVNASSHHMGEVVYKIYEMTLAEESPLRRDLERILGEPKPLEWYRRFTLKSLLGTYCGLQLRKSMREAGMNFREIRQVTSLPESICQTDLPKPKSQFVLFLCAEPDMECLAHLPSAIQDRIQQSVEFQWAQREGRSDNEWF